MDESCERLLEVIQEAWSGQFEAEELSHALQRLKAKIFANAPRSSEDLKKDKIDVSFYFISRHRLALATLDLMKLYREEVDPSILQLVNEFVESLVRDKLADVFFQLIEQNLALSHDHSECRINEIWHYTQALFYLFSRMQITSQEVLKLTVLYRKMSDAVVRHTDSASAERKLSQSTNVNPLYNDPLFKLTCYVMLCTLMECLDLSVEFYSREKGESLPNQLSHDDQFIQQMDTDHIQAKWTNTSCEGAFVLVWALFLDQCSTPEKHLPSVSRLIDRAMSHGVFQVLEQEFITSPRFLQETWDNRSCIASVLAQFFQSWRWDKILEAQQNSLYATSRTMISTNVPEYQDLLNNFRSLLSIIAHICKFSSVNVDMFLQSDHFVRFLHSVDEGMTIRSPLLLSWIELLITLCDGDQGCLEIYDFLNQSANEVNWDKIFRLLNNCLDLCLPQDDRMPRQSYSPNRHGNIQPVVHSLFAEEAAIVTALLRLIQAVARAHECQRAFWSNPDFSILDTMFGLLACRLPISLKGQVINTIRSLVSRDTATVMRIWAKLEQSQILPTNLTVPSSQDVGILFDLHQLESNQRSYPLSTAFISLLAKLIDCGPIPSLLGAGYRTPGIRVYLDFVIRSVFLYLSDMQYAYPSEKLRISAACLSLFSSLVALYDPDPDTSTPSIDMRGQNIPTERHPSYLVLHELFASRPFLTHILMVLHSTHVNLNIDENGDSSPVVIDEVDGSNLEEKCLLLSLQLLASGLEVEDNFLLSSQLKHQDIRYTSLSGSLLEPEHTTHVIAIAKCVNYSPNHDLAYYAAKIIYHLCSREPSLDLHQTGSLLVSRIRKARQEKQICLAFASQLQHISIAQSETEDDSFRVRLTILDILRTCLDLPSPNLTHLLLGFNLESRNMLQSDLGTSDRFTGMDSLVKMVLRPRFALHNPLLTEACFELLYKLVSNPRTSQPFATFLFLRHPMLFFHLLKSLPSQPDSSHQATYLQHKAWLLKSIALDLHLSIRCQNSITKVVLIELGLIKRSESTPFGLSNDSEVDVHRMQMVEILDGLRCQLVELQNEVPLILKNGQSTGTCKQFANSKTYTWDLAKLNKLLHGLGEREINHVRSAATTWNQRVKLVSSCRQALVGWRQVLEVCLFECIDPMQEPQHFIKVLCTLLSSLLQKLTLQENPIYEEIGDQLSAGAMVVMAKIRELLSLGHMRKIAQSPIVMQTVLPAILSTNHHLTRTHLYAVFINFIQFVQHCKTAALWNQSSTTGGIPSDDLTEGQDGADSRNQELLRSHSNRLLNGVCRDACDGSALLRSMAFSFLQVLIDNDKDDFWLKRLDSLAFMSSAMAQLTPFDPELRNAIFTDEKYHFIIMFESLMGFLCRAAQNKSGARTLISSGIIHVLSNCAFLDHRPNLQPSLDSLSAIPSSIERYYQLALPILSLIVALLGTASKDQTFHMDVVSVFIQRHEEALIKMIQIPAAGSVRPWQLRAVHLVTSLHYQLYAGPLLCSANPQISPDQRRILQTQEQLLIAFVNGSVSQLEGLDQTHSVSQYDTNDDNSDCILSDIYYSVLAMCRIKASYCSVSPYNW